MWFTLILYFSGSMEQVDNSTEEFPFQNKSSGTYSRPLLTQSLKMVVAIVIFAENIIICIVTPRLRRMKSTTRYLIIHLAVADLITAVGITIRFGFLLFGNKENLNIVCQVVLSLLLVSGGNSVCGIMFLAVDIHTSIKTGISLTRSSISKKHTILLISSSWVIWLFAAYIRFAFTSNMKAVLQNPDTICLSGNGYNPRSYTVTITGSIICKYFITTFILMRAVRLLGKVQNGQTAESHSNQETNQSQISGENNSTNVTHSLSERKLVRLNEVSKLTTIILTAFGICWLPILFLLVLTAALPSLHKVTSGLQPFVAIPALFHSVLNGCIYYYKSKEFQSAIKKFCFKRQNSVSISTTGTLTTE